MMPIFQMRWPVETGLVTGLNSRVRKWKRKKYLNTSSLNSRSQSLKSYKITVILC